MKVRCETCKINFTRNASLLRHIRTVHNTMELENFKCFICHSTFESTDELLIHFSLAHPRSESYEEIQSSLNSTWKMFHRRLDMAGLPEILLRENYANEIRSIFIDAVKLQPIVRAALYLFCQFLKQNPDSPQTIREVIPLKTVGNIQNISEYFL